MTEAKSYLNLYIYLKLFAWHHMEIVQLRPSN